MMADRSAHKEADNLRSSQKHGVKPSWSGKNCPFSTLVSSH
jgi:hypothetical protein